MGKKAALVYRTVCLLWCASLIGGLSAGCSGRDASINQAVIQEIEVTPSEEQDNLIPVNATFAVSGKKRLSKIQVESSFSFDPPAAFTVDKKDGVWIISPDAPFAEDTLVYLKAEDKNGVRLKTWAFQTQTGFKVTRSTPWDSENYVPLDTGIEISFSHANVEQEAFNQHFTLTNKDTGSVVPGNVKKYGETLVFIPTLPLEMSTNYQATVDADLSTPGGTALGKAYSIAFRTMEGGKGEVDYFQNYSPLTETFVTGDAPLVAISCDDAFKKRDIAVSVYRFRTAEDYAAVLADLAAQNIDPFSSGYLAASGVDIDKLDSVATFDGQLTEPEIEYYYGPQYLLLQGDYPAGWYYVRASVISPITGKELVLHKLIQVSDLSVFYLSTNGETLFWLNDTITGQPAAQATVEVSGTFSGSGVASADGTVKIPTPVSDIEHNIAVMRIQQGEKQFVDLIEAGRKGLPSLSEQYVSYLYTDRPIYMSSDTIRLWGFVRPRMSGSRDLDNLRVSLMDYGEELYSVPVSLSPDGTFTAELPFTQLGGEDIRYTTVELKAGNPAQSESLSYASINIGDYVKPVYVPSVSLDKPVYFAGDKVQMTFSATFFDNTPVSGFQAEYSCGGGELLQPEEDVLVTGDDGMAQKELALSEVNGASGWRPHGVYFQVSNHQGENKNFYYSKYIQVLDRDLALRGEVNGDTLKVQTNRMDVSRIREDRDLEDYDNFMGEAANVNVTAELHKTYYTKAEKGTYYDFIQKKNIVNYEYISHDDIIETKSFTTSGGIYELGGLPESDPDACYYVVLSAPDSMGRVVEETVWLWYNNFYSADNLHNYSFFKRGANEDYQSQANFEDGETVTFDVQDNGLAAPAAKVLTAVVQQGIVRYEVLNTAQATIPFDESLIPNYYIAGAYFDGRYVYQIGSSEMRFDPGNRKLDFDIQPDQEKYTPGDTAKVDISVTYHKDGSVAANAPVLLSIVDEAIFAIDPYYNVDPLTDIYRSVSLTSVTSYSSYIQYNFTGSMAGEKGGGGGDEGVRSDFKDTAAFVTAITDASGRASFEIPLPDNITSWRATAQCITEDLHAGSEDTPIIVSGRFFINEVLADQYIAGDNASLTLRCYGSSVKAEDMVNYTVTVEGNGQKTEETAAGHAGDVTAVPMGMLSKGTYTVTMQAEFDGMQDTVQKTIKVVGSGVEASLVKTFNLKDGISIDAARFPVTLGFYNADYAVWSQVLSHLLRNSYGSRTDERMARQYALKKIGEMSDNKEFFVEEDDFSEIIFDSGAVRLFPYDSTDIGLTARAHVAMPELFGNHVEYFYNELGMTWTGEGSGNVENAAISCLGLAAHKKPVLNRIRSLLANAETYSDRTRLYLIAALAVVGDVDGAREQYDKWVQPSLKESVTGDGDKALSFDKGTDENKTMELTALASITASVLRSGDADAMMFYLMANRSTQNLYLLEEIHYLRCAEPSGDTSAVINYLSNGEKQTLDLKELGMRFVYFTAENFHPEEIKAVKGEVGVQASYTGSLEEVESSENKSITMTRTIVPVEGAMKEGALVKITLTPTLPMDTIDPDFTVINDYIPSGMRFLYVEDESQDELGYPWVLTRSEGQRVMFTYYSSGGLKGYKEEIQSEEPVAGETKYPPMKPLIYYARCTAPGDYVADSAYIRTASAPFWGTNPKEMVRIEE